MRKSREVFTGIVVALMAATLGAFVGAIAGGIATKWLAMIALLIVSVKGICQLVAERMERNLFSNIVDGVTVLLIGGIIGSLNIISSLIYAIAFVFAAIICLVFIFGFTGHIKDSEE